jgi:hypothetical protein
MEKTPTIDVYRLISGEGKSEGYAYIRGIDSSRKIRGWFNGGLTHVTAKCEWNNSFDKWEPISIE